MIKRIFKSTLLVSLLTFFCSMVIIMGVLYHYFDNQLMKELENEANYVSTSVELLGETYLESLITKNRITWIDESGNVLYDNMADKESMENHADREEYMEAVSDGYGKAERYSNTLSQKTVYYAILLEGGSVVRVSTTQFTPLTLLVNMLQPILIVMVVAVILSAVLASKLSKKIVEPINKIDLENPSLEDNYDELSDFIRRIRKQNEVIAFQMEELERKQKEFTTITENMTEGFVVIDTDTEILSYNSSAQRLLGADMQGKNFFKKTTSVYTMNRSEVFRTAVEAALNGKSDNRVMERQGRYLQILSNPVLEQEKIAGAVLIIIDVTESEEREKLRREFTSNVSHELKTPLTSIYGLSDLLRNDMVRREDVTEFGKNIHDETGRLISLVNDILRISQLDEGSGLGEKGSVDLYELSLSVLKRLESVAEKRNILLQLEGQHETVLGYFGIISEVLYNLCDNAVKYNKENGKVIVYIREEDDYIKWSVTDSGIGIKQTELERIFERFYRVDKSHSKKIGGTGLGLAIVKHGCICNNAKISVSSVEGEGSCFTITFQK